MEDKPPASIMEPRCPLPRVFMDLKHGNDFIGRVVIELFVHKTPITCENFRSLCIGSKPPVPVVTGTTAPATPLTYKGNIFHRVVSDFMIQGGDITNQNGTGGLAATEPRAVTAKAFKDENLGWRTFDQAGLVCMANRGPHTNTSQFFITLDACEYLTNKHTLFGRVVKGMDVAGKVSHVPVDTNDRPNDPVMIVDCGEVSYPGLKSGNESKNAANVWLGKWNDESDDDDNGDGDKRPTKNDGTNAGDNMDGKQKDQKSQESVELCPTVEDEAAPPPLSRGRSRSRSRSRSLDTTSPDSRRHRHRRRHRHKCSRSDSGRRHTRRRYRSVSRSRSRSRSPRRHRRRDNLNIHYTRDDPYIEERLRREEQEREQNRSWEDNNSDTIKPHSKDPSSNVKFKGRGSMKYRERQTWGSSRIGGYNNYGRLV